MLVIFFLSEIIFFTRATSDTKTNPLYFALMHHEEPYSLTSTNKTLFFPMSSHGAIPVMYLGHIHYIDSSFLEHIMMYREY